MSNVKDSQMRRRKASYLPIIFTLLASCLYFSHGPTKDMSDSFIANVSDHDLIRPLLSTKIHRQPADGEAWDLLQQLMRDPASLNRTSGKVSFAANTLVTNEADFIEEWLIYHRLLGIERFYLYDFENSKDLAALLAPWIEAGIVVHHTMTYEDPSIPSANFMSRATHHFSTNYAKSIEWTFFFDVDEYINLSTVYNAHPTPWRENGEWHYPLQEIMRWPSDRGARCVELSRSGVFLNVGQIEHTPRTSVIERHFYREQRNRITQPGKPVIRSSSDGLLAEWLGHGCSAGSGYSTPRGVLAPDEPGTIADSQGSPLPNSDDPLIFEPINVQHFEQRSLQDCKDKLRHIHDKTNWRVLSGGASRCDKVFVPSAKQMQALSNSNDATEIDMRTMPNFWIVQDTSLQRSWYGRAAMTGLAQLRKGHHMPCRDPAAAIAQVTHLTVSNPS